MLWIICMIYILTTLCAARDVTLDTDLGQVIGVKEKLNGKTIFKFLGIPYAKPPIGSLRFVKPVPYGAYNETLDATDFRSFCPQLSSTNTIIGDEDCLFINIYTPKLTGSKGMTVMIWSHGGTFVRGESNSFHPEVLAYSQNVVVVTFNYRLNTLGFLAKRGTELVGNYALFDHQMVIQWVKDNIHDFGGSGSSITLFGQSSGAFMITYQMMTPLNDASLFQRGITQSGSALSTNALTVDPDPVANTFIAATGCNATGLMDCLRNKTMEELLQATGSPSGSLVFTPVIDGDFVPSYLVAQFVDFVANSFAANKSFSLGNFGEYDIMSGWNDQDGLNFVFIAEIVNYLTNGMSLDNGISSDVLVQSLLAVAGAGSENSFLVPMLDILINYYINTPFPINLNDVTDDVRRLSVFANISGDVIFVAPSVQQLQLHSLINSGKSAYAYLFSNYRNYQGVNEGPQFLRTGSSHGDEVPYVFGYPVLPEEQCRVALDVPTCDFSRQEQRLSKNVMKRWANFAKSGNPKGMFERFQYPEDQAYTRLSTGRPETLYYPRQDKVRLIAALDYTAVRVN